MAHTYHATPYDISATGFYFTSYDEYVEKAAEHKNEHGDPVEEYEIQYIDGAPWEYTSQMFNALKINQTTLELWFDKFEELDGDEAIKVIYLAEWLSYSDLDDLLDTLREVSIHEGNAETYAERYIEDCGILEQVPDFLKSYIDTWSLGRDLHLSGDIVEFELFGKTYVGWGG